jgi:predicted secreted protein
VAEITSISPPSVSRDDIETTHYDSDDGFKEYMAGLADGGDISIECNLIVGDTNGQQGLRADYEAGTVQSFELALPNAANSSWEINAIVKEYSESSPIGDKLGFTAILKVTGKPTLIMNDGSTGLTTPFFSIFGTNSGTLTISPSASGTIYLYSTSAHINDGLVSVTPTAAAGTIYVNGTITTSGSPASVPLIHGVSVPAYIVVKETAKSPKVYKINIFRP